MDKIIFLNFNIILKDVSFKLENDIYAYSLSKNSLKKSFFIYRLSEELLQKINNAKKINSKILLYIEEGGFNFDIFDYKFAENILRRISKFLKINIFKNVLSYKEFEKLLTGNSGESIEIRSKIQNIINKNSKNINLRGFYKYLSKNNIQKIQSTFNNDNIKLGIFLT